MQNFIYAFVCVAGAGHAAPHAHGLRRLRADDEAVRGRVPGVGRRVRAPPGHSPRARQAQARRVQDRVAHQPRAQAPPGPISFLFSHFLKLFVHFQLKNIFI